MTFPRLSVICYSIILSLSTLSHKPGKVIYQAATLPEPPKYVGIVFPIKDAQYSALYDESAKAAIEELSLIPGLKIEFLGTSGILSFKSPQCEEIERICTEKKLDGLVLLRQYLIANQILVYATPIGSDADSEAECKYYSKDGSLLLHALYNTQKHSSYSSRPNASQVAIDSVKGAIHKIVIAFMPERAK